MGLVGGMQLAPKVLEQSAHIARNGNVAEVYIPMTAVLHVSEGPCLHPS